MHRGPNDKYKNIVIGQARENKSSVTQNSNTPSEAATPPTFVKSTVPRDERRSISIGSKVDSQKIDENFKKLTQAAEDLYDNIAKSKDQQPVNEMIGSHISGLRWDSNQYQDIKNDNELKRGYYIDTIKEHLVNPYVALLEELSHRKKGNKFMNFFTQSKAKYNAAEGIKHTNTSIAMLGSALKKVEQFDPTTFNEILSQMPKDKQQGIRESISKIQPDQGIETPRVSPRIK